MLSGLAGPLGVRVAAVPSRTQDTAHMITRRPSPGPTQRYMRVGGCSLRPSRSLASRSRSEIPGSAHFLDFLDAKGKTFKTQPLK